jgi:hypothetical protein
MRLTIGAHPRAGYGSGGDGISFTITSGNRVAMV